MPKLRNRRTKAAAIGAAAVLAFAAAGLAYFTATGSGSGPAYVGNAEGLTISSAAPLSELYPGGSSDLAATVHNPSPVAVHVHSFVLGPDGITNDKPGCGAGDVAFDGPVTNGGGDFVFPPGDSALTLPNAISMSPSAADACQGATFTVSLEAGS